MEPETAEKQPQEEDQEQEHEITAAQTEEQPMEQQHVEEQPVEEQASEEQPESQDGEQEQEEEEKYIPRLLDAAGNVNTYLRNKMHRNYCVLSCRQCNPAIKRSDPRT